LTLKFNKNSIKIQLHQFSTFLVF